MALDWLVAMIVTKTFGKVFDEGWAYVQRRAVPEPRTPGGRPEPQQRFDLSDGQVTTDVNLAVTTAEQRPSAADLRAWFAGQPGPSWPAAPPWTVQPTRPRPPGWQARPSLPSVPPLPAAPSVRARSRPVLLALERGPEWRRLVPTRLGDTTRLRLDRGLYVLTVLVLDIPATPGEQAVLLGLGQVQQWIAGSGVESHTIAAAPPTTETVRSYGLLTAQGVPPFRIAPTPAPAAPAAPADTPVVPRQRLFPAVTPPRAALPAASTTPPAGTATCGARRLSAACGSPVKAARLCALHYQLAKVQQSGTFARPLVVWHDTGRPVTLPP